jgi:small subunit ribosomal protein S6
VILETVTKKLYEGMFLVDSGLAGSDWDGVLASIENILQRAEAETISLQKWGERKLAYDIDHKSRGTYVLCYFRADGSRIAGIEKDVRLSERIMRVLILRADKHMTEQIERDLAAAPAEEAKAEAGQKTESAQVGASRQTQQETASQAES